MNYRFFAVVLPVIAAISASAQTIPRFVMASQGAQAVQTGQYVVFGTLGQPIVGFTGNGSRRISQGYWTPLPVITSADGGETVAGLSLTAFPMPFSGELTVEYTLSYPAMTTLRIIDARGSEVARIEEQYRTPGGFQTIWRPSGELKASLSSGVYFLECVSSSAERTDVLRRPLLMLR